MLLYIVIWCSVFVAIFGKSSYLHSSSDGVDHLIRLIIKRRDEEAKTEVRTLDPWNSKLLR